jgi:hypothetical protein
VEGVASAIGNSVNVDIFSDVNVLLTLTLNQPTFLQACQKFRDDIIREKLEVKITTSIRKKFDEKALGVNNLVGRVLGGVINHLSVTTTRGRDELLESASLTESDKQILREYFKNQILAVGDELEKNQLRSVEAWVITKFEDSLRKSRATIPLVDFLGILFQLNQDAYESFSTSYAMLFNDLRIGAPISVTPSSTSNKDIEIAGVSDPEDIEHLASIYDYIKPMSRKAVFVSTDYRHVISNQVALSKLEIHCEDPIYAIDKYKSLL